MNTCNEATPILDRPIDQESTKRKGLAPLAFIIPLIIMKMGLAPLVFIVLLIMGTSLFYTGFSNDISQKMLSTEAFSQLMRSSSKDQNACKAASGSFDPNSKYVLHGGPYQTCFFIQPGEYCWTKSYYHTTSIFSFYYTGWTTCIPKGMSDACYTYGWHNDDKYTPPTCGPPCSDVLEIGNNSLPGSCQLT